MMVYFIFELLNLHRNHLSVTILVYFTDYLLRQNMKKATILPLTSGDTTATCSISQNLDYNLQNYTIISNSLFLST